MRKTRPLPNGISRAQNAPRAMSAPPSAVPFKRPEGANRPRRAARPGRPPKRLRPFSSPKYVSKIHRGPGRFMDIDELELRQILALVRAGTYPLAAVVKILGCSKDSFYAWEKKADEQRKNPDGDQRFADFFAMLDQASAHARAGAESYVTEKQPLDALRYGHLGRPEWSRGRGEMNSEDGGEAPATLRVQIVVTRLGIESREERAPERPAITAGANPEGASSSGK